MIIFDVSTHNEREKGRKSVPALVVGYIFINLDRHFSKADIMLLNVLEVSSCKNLIRLKSGGGDHFNQ